MLSAKQAAEATGVTKQAIIRAIKRGTVSAEKDVHGEWTIDAAELFRHYQPVSLVHTNGADVHTLDGPSVETLQMAVTQLEMRLQEMSAARDDVMRAKDRVIDVLSQENVRLTAVVAQLSPPQARKGWWARLLGGEAK